MTAETAPRPGWQVRAQDSYQQKVRYGIVLAALAHMLLRDRRFHVTVIVSVIGAVALNDLIKNNQARPVRRAASWYNSMGASKELASAHPRARQELARAGQTLKAGKRS
jgi:hypothetical protein